MASAILNTVETVPQEIADTSKPIWVDTREARALAAQVLWDWVVLQPQTVWLNIVRDGNPDEWELDWIKMVNHPQCDRAVASYLFWKFQPSYYLAHGERPREDGTGNLMAHILNRAEKGGWPAATIHYDRVEVALEALETARTIATTPSVPFAIPRQLCANFEGDNETPKLVGDETIAQIDYAFDMFANIDELANSQTVRSDRHQTKEDYYDVAFQFPAHSVVTADMTDLQAITAVFGDWELGLSKVATLKAERFGTAQQRMGNPATAPDPARRWWSGAARFLIISATGASAMVAALHFLGPMAAVVALILWVGVLLQQFL
jgi:hypothetical protein